MIPSNVFSRVIHIAVGGFTATGTMIHVGGREYLVTARHFAKLIADSLDMYHDGQWKTFPVKLIAHSEGADVSVLAFPTSFIGLSLSVHMTLKDMIWSGDVYFLGFPFGLSSEVGSLNARYPMPFVKRAIVSNFARDDLGADFWLDGYNNVGFSGGPVVSVHPQTMECTIRGFICSYYTTPEEIKIGENTDTSTYYANSGLIMAARVGRALDIIAANPIGPLAS